MAKTPETITVGVQVVRTEECPKCGVRSILQGATACAGCAYREGRIDALNEIEKRIRHQTEAAAFDTWAWRAHMADLAHISAIRLDWGIS